MAFPKTTGDLVSAADWNSIFDVAAARVRRLASQLIADDTITIVAHDGVTYDTDGMWDAGSPGRLTIQTAGIYRVSANAAFSANPTGDRRALIYRNGDVYARQSQRAANSAADGLSVTDTLNGSVGDFIELRVYQTSNANRNLTVASLAVERIRPPA